jgi:hypothetical protein
LTSCSLPPIKVPNGFQCFVVQDRNVGSVLFDLDDKFQWWEDNLPPEYQQDRDEHVTKYIDQAELLVIDQQRYTFITWYLMCRTKLYLGAITGSGVSSRPWAEIKEKSRRCIILSMRQIRLQCDTHTAALQRRAHGEEAFPGNYWIFEGCISLAEATAVLLTILTRFPLKEKVKEAVELVDRAIAVFTHVVSEQTGKQGEIARMAAKVLGALREEDWWKSQASTYNSSATAPVPDDTKPFDAGYDWYSSDSRSSPFHSPPYALSGIRDVTGGMGFTTDSSSSRSRTRVPEGRDIHMADLLSEGS